MERLSGGRASQKRRKSARSGVYFSQPMRNAAGPSASRQALFWKTWEGVGSPIKKECIFLIAKKVKKSGDFCYFIFIDCGILLPPPIRFEYPKGGSCRLG